MKILIAILVAATAATSASAQDRQGRQRQPPSSSGGSQGSGSGSSSGGSSGSSGSSGRSSTREPDRPQRNDPPPTRSGGDGGGARRRDPGNDGGGSRDSGRHDNGGWSGGNASGGTARRRVPIGERPDQGSSDRLRGGGTAPDRTPTDGVAGHAVRRDSLPPRSHTGAFDGWDPSRHYGERERGRYYWNEWRGHRYCHYVDGGGIDWYIWYFDDGYYSMRYMDGRWWRYDYRYNRWCWLRDHYWYYQEGLTVYVYEEDRGGFTDSDNDGPDAPIQAPKVSVTGHLGYFGMTGGGQGNVIDENRSYLDFDGAGIGGLTTGAELNVGVGNNAEVGVGAGYFTGAVNTHYRDYVNGDGSELRQQLRVTNVPVDANVKWFPTGRDSKVQPYLGGGVQLNKWSYEESGQFIDFNSANMDVYKEKYKANGVAVGPVAIAGLRVPLNKKVSIGGEYRYQWAKGQLPVEGGFAGDHLDLGGGSFRAGVTVNLK